MQHLQQHTNLYEKTTYTSHNSTYLWTCKKQQIRNKQQQPDKTNNQTHLHATTSNYKTEPIHVSNLKDNNNTINEGSKKERKNEQQKGRKKERNNERSEEHAKERKKEQQKESKQERTK